MKRNSFYLLIVSFLFIIIGCEKSEEIFTVKFKLGNENHIYRAGFAEKMHDIFFFNQLVGGNQEMTEGITINFKENESGIYSSNDTVAVYINLNNTDFYVFSNWTSNTPYSGTGESFNLRITFEDEERIQGEFSGSLWHITIPSNNEYEIVELVDGKFDLHKK
jgi:hypothetical protein